MYKYKYLVFIIIIICTIFIDKTYSYRMNDIPLSNKIIYIDPGHGGVDPGAIYKDLKESDINLMFAKTIGKYLEQLGGTIYYTRDDDYDLSSTTIRRKRSDLTNRIKLINDSNADIYLSIHVNSENSNSWYGSQIFYTVENSNNILLAKVLQNNLYKENISKREISVIKNTYMYERIKIPGVLIETGFISNYSDRIKLQDTEYINKFSQIVAEGIIEYFN